MTFFSDLLVGMSAFMELGGPVLYAILAVTAIMWALMIERIWYLARVLPHELRLAMPDWQHVREAVQATASSDAERDWHLRAARREVVSRIGQSARSHLAFIQALMLVLPLLGLLGTVLGMVHVFDIMTLFGTGNARLMASGVSRATIPTMCGLVAALSGLYLIYWLRQRASRLSEQLASHLKTHADPPARARPG